MGSIVKGLVGACAVAGGAIAEVRLEWGPEEAFALGGAVGVHAFAAVAFALPRETKFRKPLSVVSVLVLTGFVGLASGGLDLLAFGEDLSHRACRFACDVPMPRFTKDPVTTAAVVSDGRIPLRALP